MRYNSYFVWHVFKRTSVVSVSAYTMDRFKGAVKTLKLQIGIPEDKPKKKTAKPTCKVRITSYVD